MVNMFQFMAVSLSSYQDFQARTTNELNVSCTPWSWKICLAQNMRHHTPSKSVGSFYDELTVSDGIVCKGINSVVPPSLRLKYTSHTRESPSAKNIRLEKPSWSRMCLEIDKMVENCTKCQTYQNKQDKETIKPTPLPDLSWMEVALRIWYIFDGKDSSTMVTIDYTYVDGYWYSSFLQNFTERE